MGITRQAAQQRFAPSPLKKWFVQEWMASYEVDENRQMVSLSKDRALLSASVTREKGEPFLVEVFA